MYNRGTLAKTGSAVALFGGTMAFEWTIGVILGLVILGAVAYRYANRGRRYTA
ncbi:hypothetical protein ACWDO7_22815 [Streptomyces sp. NPDC003656]|uniref:hypothetical protein n=1 Tax=Streptomyces sp. NPDC091385 TaxID=3365997 RepID=UPI0037FE6007